jgi:hypothetical protein
MGTRTTILLLVLVLLVGYAFGRYLQPAHEVIKTQTVTVEHEHTVTVVVTKPDGTSTSTTTTDKGETAGTKTSTTIDNVKPQWKVSALAGLGLNSPISTVYGGEVQRRILGPIFVGAWATTNRTGGISLGLEF